MSAPMKRQDAIPGVSPCLRIDSHQHFWLADRFDYPWMDRNNPVLFRDYLPEDLAPVLVRHRIDLTLAVQASPSLEETDFLLALAQKHSFVAGVVGWLDLESRDFRRQLDRYKKRAGFVGVRPAVEFLEDDRWLLRPPVLDSLQRMADEQVPLDLIVWPRHLPVVVEMLARTPGLRGVVDHLAKPDIKDCKLQPWKSHLAEIARYRGLYCKLSGMSPHGGPAPGLAQRAEPFVDHVLSCFGVERLMFGSDWPICLAGSSYGEAVEVVRKTLASVWNQSVESAVFGGNAARFYRIDDG